jgi:uncharacterized RDD family membrane protein YckC
MEAQTVIQDNEYAIKYAGFWIRVLAFIIDTLVLVIPNIIINIVFSSISMPNFGSVFIYLVSLAYYILMTKKYGATIGKKALGIQVHSYKSNELSWGQLILRETIGKIISALIFLIGYIMIAFTKKKQALHDIMAGTVVIYKINKYKQL